MVGYYSALKGRFIKAQGSALGTVVKSGGQPKDVAHPTNYYSALKGRFIKAQGSALGTVVKCHHDGYYREKRDSIR